MMKLFAITLAIFLVLVSSGFAIIWRTDTSVDAFDTCGGSSCNNITGANDTSWSSYAWVVCGGSPCSATHLYENYSYNSQWISTSYLNYTFKYNSSYGNTYLQLWNYTSGAWINCDFESMASIPVNLTCSIGNSSRGNYTNATNPLRFNIDGTVGLNSNGTWYEGWLEYDLPYFNITNCTSGNKYLTFIGKDETTKNNMTYSLDLTVSARSSDGINVNKSFSLSGSNNYSICIDPPGYTYYTNVSAKASATGYSTRYYYLDNSAISSETSVNLYLLNSSDSTLITMKVMDEVDNPESDVVIIVQKQDLGTGTYTQIAEGKTDFSGYTYIYLKAHDLYKFLLTKNGVVLKEYQPMQLETDSLEFHVSTAVIPEYFTYYDKVATGCTYDNSTLNLTCTYIDTSGLDMNMSFKVIRIGIAGETTLCNDNSSSASGSFICGLTGNYTYKYSLIGTYYSNPVDYLWQSGYISLISPGGVSFGAVGLFLALIIVIALPLLFNYDARISIVMSAFGIIFSIVTGLIKLQVDQMAMIFSIAIISGLIAFRTRS